MELILFTYPSVLFSFFVFTLYFTFTLYLCLSVCLSLSLGLSICLSASVCLTFFCLPFYYLFSIWLFLCSPMELSVIHSLNRSLIESQYKKFRLQRKIFFIKNIFFSFTLSVLFTIFVLIKSFQRIFQIDGGAFL